MGLFTLQHCCVTYFLDYSKSKLGSKIRLPIPEFSGSLCGSNCQSLNYLRFTPSDCKDRNQKTKV